LSNPRPPALMVFEDGTTFQGISIGKVGESFGEVVFNTSMTGYQEILTDPSYRGQIVLMTYPLIGNYGINPSDMESRRCHLEGFVVRELSRVSSNFRSHQDLQDFLVQSGVVGIAEVDTRTIVQKVRSGRPLRCGISATAKNAKDLLERVLASNGTDGQDLAREVTRGSAERWSQATSPEHFQPDLLRCNGERLRVVAYDFGLKNNILRSLVSAGFEVQVVPGTTSAEEALSFKPDGVFLSNGPGDPEAVRYAIATSKELMDRNIPIFGICLGHQILGLALGGKTRKMQFGHHGANQPVMDLSTGKIEITAQNHSYVVDEDTLDPSKVEITHRNLNDQTVEGLRHRQLPMFAVQYHPEAAPGPHDSVYLFERFRKMILDHVGAPVGAR